MVWVEFFLSLGFIGFFTIWALFVGSIAVFGVFEKLKRNINSIAKHVIVSWLAGYFLVSLSPVGSLVIAVIIRFLAVGVSSVLSFSKLDEMPIKISRKGVIYLALPLGAVILLGIASFLFSPPMQLGWYDVDNVKIAKLEDRTSVDVKDVTWGDIKDSRIVAQEYALQLPKTLITETGWRLSFDHDGVYPINNTLYWVMAYEPDKLMNFAENSPAYIIVNAQDPSDRRKISENIPYSEERGGLNVLYQLANGKIRDAKFILWLRYPFFDYGDAIFTHDDEGNPVWIAPAKLSFPTIFVTTFFVKQVGIVSLDIKGEVKFYSSEEIRNGEAPSWLETQILIDEEYTEMRLDKWAKYSSWNNFINYQFEHENVFEIAQDLYFQYDKKNDRNYAIIQLEPEGEERTSITHFAEIDSSTKDFGKITIFDTRELNLIGPARALNDVRGQISLYSDWYALQPIFRNIKNGYFYVVPVYSGTHESMVLRAVAVVDAKTEQVKLFKWEDVKSGVADSIPIDETQKREIINRTEECRIVSTENVDGKTRIVIECS